LEQFTASKVKVWFPASSCHTDKDEGYIGGRIDLMIVPPQKKAEPKYDGPVFEHKGCFNDKGQRAIPKLAGKGFCGEEGRKRC
jgi:hypothetical protein